MKKIVTLLILLSCSIIFAQEDPPPQNADPLITDFQVLNIHGDVAQILVHGRKYLVSITPEINPFGYQMEADREYTMAIVRDMEAVERYQTRGQTKTLEARLIWFAPSRAQLERDKIFMDRLRQSNQNGG